MKQSIKAGTRIELLGTPAMGDFPAVPPEAAVIGRWTARNGAHVNRVHKDGEAGWHVVRFADGGGLMVHESRFRVIDK